MTGMVRRALKRLPAGVKSHLRSAVHPAQRLQLQRTFVPRVANWGLLTVVIPTFNVEKYLAECLNSVISQSYPHLEIILVDDGSTDSTLRIAREYARWDKRIQVIAVEHGGNGRARNIGIKAARGPYLTFADSDDMVAADAYRTMMRSIHSRQSNFVVGSSDRLIGSKRVATKLSSTLHAQTRRGISLAEFPDVIDDVFLWNKLFSRNFWDECVGPIPEGVLYEDQETTARAFVRAQAFDVLTENVYSWRHRPDGNSITQGKGEIKNLQDRLAVAHRVSQLLLAEGNSSTVQVWCKRLFGSDLMPYFDLVANRGDDYWESLRDGAAGLLSLFVGAQCIGDETWYAMDPHARIFLHLAAANAREDLEAVIVDRIDSGTGFEVRAQDDSFVAVPNYWDELAGRRQIPVLACTQEALAFESGIRIRDLQDARGLVLCGHGYVRGLDSQQAGVSIECRFTLSNGAEISVPLSFVEDPRIDVEANDPFASHTGAGFEVLLEDHPDLSSATGVHISMTVGQSTWTRTHTLDMAGILNRLGLGVASQTPQVVSFDVDEDSETFSIDVDWGAAKPSEETYLSTAQIRIDPAGDEEVGANLRRYTFELHHHHWGRQVYSYPSGAYTLRHKASQSTKAQPFKASAEIGVRSPLDFRLPHSNLVAWQTAGGTFAVTMAAPLTDIERSKYGQRRLQQTFLNSEPRNISSHVVFESFNGKFCTDSPRAIAEELHRQESDKTTYFSIQDYSVPYPPYAVPLVRGTAEWVDKVQSASHLVNNNNFPFYFRKSPEQFYLQTWHGTPLKKIGLDAPKDILSASYRQLMSREAKMWDVLLAQNPFSSRVLPIAFGFGGTVLESGYPRNDDLAATDRDTRRIDIRESLGIPAGQRVILYAPTWRDGALRRDGTRKPLDLIDFRQVEEQLGSNVMFLCREHHNVVSSRSDPTERNWIDVSSYPEINDLILASDALITDYSSIVFDYYRLNKPIFILVPDLEEYGNFTRGLYRDIDAVGTWPIYTSTSRLYEQLVQYQRIDKRVSQYALMDEYIPFDIEVVSHKILSDIFGISPHF